jgi:hypothetical protein
MNDEAPLAGFLEAWRQDPQNDSSEAPAHDLWLQTIVTLMVDTERALDFLPLPRHRDRKCEVRATGEFRVSVQDRSQQTHAGARRSRDDDRIQR